MAEVTDDPAGGATPRRLHAVREAPSSRLDARLASREIHQALSERELDPFLVVSLFEMSGPVFPPHPHVGFSVATYILPESPVGFINQDSLGTRNEIASGGLHATVAGSGVLHEEQPLRAGMPALGYQVWIDHRNGARAVPPRPETLEAAAVPVHTADGVWTRVLIGEAHGLRSPIALPTPVRLLDVGMPPNSTWRTSLPPEERGFLVMISGSGSVGGTEVPASHVATLGASGTDLVMHAGAAGARLTLFAGVPLDQSRVFGGPVVGGSRAEVEAFLRSARAGAFGVLRGF